MHKHLSKLMVTGAAVAALLGSVAIAEAGSALTNTDGKAVKSPFGTQLGAAQLFAVVNANGSTQRGGGNHIAGTVRLGLGTYDVRFYRNITACSFNGTIGLSGFLGSSAPGMITVVGRAGSNNGVFVQTFNSSGALVDLGFHLTIICA